MICLDRAALPSRCGTIEANPLAPHPSPLPAGGERGRARRLQPILAPMRFRGDERLKLRALLTAALVARAEGLIRAISETAAHAQAPMHLA